MGNKIKNVIMVFLVCVIVVLCSVIAFMLGSKYTDNNDQITNDTTVEDKEQNIQEKIEFVGDKTVEVSYNPIWNNNYNLNYKINENGQLVFTDINNNNNSIVYHSIEGICKYVTIAIPKGKLEPLYYISVITEDGKVYFKEIYAYGDIGNDEYTAGKGSMDDNFLELENPTESKFNGISMKTQSELKNVISDFQTISINSVDGKEYYVTKNKLENIELKQFN